MAYGRTREISANTTTALRMSLSFYIYQTKHYFITGLQRKATVMFNGTRNLNNSFIQTKLFPQHVVEFRGKLIDRRVNQFLISQ